MKPVEFVCKRNADNQALTDLVIFYDDGNKKTITIEANANDYGIIYNRHYNITDLYGYGVIEEREEK